MRAAYMGEQVNIPDEMCRAFCFLFSVTVSAPYIVMISQ